MCVCVEGGNVVEDCVKCGGLRQVWPSANSGVRGRRRRVIKLYALLKFAKICVKIVKNTNKVHLSSSKTLKKKIVNNMIRIYLK